MIFRNAFFATMIFATIIFATLMLTIGEELPADTIGDGSKKYKEGMQKAL